MSKIIPFYQIISCFFFALLGLQIKLQLQESSIEDIVFHRSLFKTLILFFFVIFRKDNIKNVFKTKISIFISLDQFLEFLLCSLVTNH